MWLFVVKNWKAIGAVAATAALAFMLHTLSVNSIEKKHADDIVNAKAEAVKECEDEKKLSEEVANDLQSKINSLSSRHDASRRVRGGKCVPVFHRPDAAVSNDAKTRNK